MSRSISRVFARDHRIPLVIEFARNGTVGRVTVEFGEQDKRRRLRYAATCRLCRALLSAGADAVYERTTKTVRCVECRADLNSPEPGVAGASARREFERRKNNRETRIRATHPKIGGLILALSDDPQSTRAWERGAIGEERMASRLAELPTDTFRVLHDRRIPGTRANIDHIVVSPSGVWVIDAKRYTNKRPELRVEGGIIRPRVESLRVGGRDQTNLVTGVQSQVERVTGVIDDPTIAVAGVLCFIDADWPLVGGSFTVNGIHALWPRLLLKRIVAAPASGVDVQSVHRRLAGAFPRA